MTDFTPSAPNSASPVTVLPSASVTVVPVLPVTAALVRISTPASRAAFVNSSCRSARWMVT